MASGTGAKLIVSYRDYDSNTLLDQKTYSNLTWNDDGESAYVSIEDGGRVLDFDGYEFRSVTVDPVYITSAKTFYTTVYYDAVEPDVTYYTLTVNYEDTSGNEFDSTEDEYEDGTVVDSDDYRVSKSGYVYVSASASSVTMSKDRTLTMYYEKTSAASWSLSSSTANSATFKITLPDSYSNYTQLEFQDTNTSKWYTGYSAASSVTVTGLSASTSYKFQCRVTVESGNQYYIENSSRYITVTTASNKATLTLKHVGLDGTTLETETISATIGYTITPMHSNYYNTYTNYQISYVKDSSGTKYSSSSTTYAVNGNDTLTYYYEKISGTDASLKVYHRLSGTTTDLVAADVYSNCYWNSTHNNNTADLTNSSYIKTIEGYTYVESVPTTIIFNESKQYEGTIYYKANTTGNNATVVISHKDKDDDREIAAATTLSNLYWNSETEDNYVEVKNYPATVNGYAYDSASPAKVICQAPTTYYATAYYRKTKGNNASLLLKYVDESNTDIVLNTKTFTDLWWDSETEANFVTLTDQSYIETFDGYEYVESVPPTVIFKEPKQYEAEIRYRELQTATFYVSNVMPTSFELTVELTAPFTADNYQQIIFTGTKEDYSGAFLNWAVDEATSTGTTQIISTDKNGVQLTPGNTYTVYCYAQAKNGLYYPVKTVDGEAYTEVTLPAMAVTDGIYGKWCALFNTPEATWSNNSVCFEFTFTEIYPFSSKYFAEIGVIAEEFIEESDALPGTILASVQATDIETTAVQLFIENLAPGTVQPAYLYIKTLDGMYVPIPFGEVGIFGKETITKPNTLGYTAGYAPVTGNAVNLLASDILQFISAADCTARWVFDRTEAGINSDLVIQNENIYAATFQEFASFIIDVSNNVSFVNNFQYVNAGDKIEASNLNELPISLNNMLGAL